MSFFRVRQEFVQRRIEEADRDRPPGHRFEDADEVLALVREEFVERLDARAFGFRDNHLAHRRDALRVEEHVLGAAKADAFGAELHSDVRIVRRIGVGAHFHAARGVSPFHHRTRSRR